MTAQQRITVLGLGNILLQDEGFGVHFINRFEKRSRMPDYVSLIDGGVLGYGLLDTVTSCDRLIVIDVIKVDDEPGSLYRFSREEMELHRPPATSAHEVEFVDVLTKAELIDKCPQTVFLCIVPQEIGEMRVGMTPLMESRFADMEELLIRELERLGIKLEGAVDAGTVADPVDP